jgi:TPP-dependent pyruvate/acetoin dehydrogenase alpha subunit
MPMKVKARSATAAVAGKNGHSLINNEKFRQLYAALLKSSLLEERLNRVPADGADEWCSQAAGAVGITVDLEREDTVVLAPRCFVTNLITGIQDWTGVNDGHANGMLPYPEVNVLTAASCGVSAQIGLATGAALANKLAGNHKIAVAFLDGDAAGLKGCSEAFELAAAYKLPVLYVVEKSLGKREAGLLEQIGDLFPVIPVDAEDVVAVYRVAQESMARVREGGGPAMIACMPYPLNGATVHPVARMEHYLAGRNLFKDEWKDEVLAGLHKEMATI